MRIKSSLRKQMIVAIFLGCSIPYFLGGIYLNTFLKEWLYQNSIQNSKQILSQVDELLDRSLITDMKEEVNLLASLDIVVNADQQLTKYLDESTGDARQELSETESAISDYFKSMKDSHTTTNFVFFGTEDGGYMEYPVFTTTKSYDPRLRPWYINTIQKQGIVMSEPYITNVTNEIVVSFTKAVIKDDRAIGVIGISVNLKELTNSIRKLKIGESGYVMLLSPDYKFIVSPNHTDWVLKTPIDLGLKDFLAMYSVDEATFETELDGEIYVLNTMTSRSSGLHVMTVMCKDEILENAGVIASILSLIYAGTLVIIFIVVFQISKYITRPILEIASVIDHMTDFNFHFEEASHVDAYAKRSDEIGTVSTALLEMHANYKELITQVNHINQEINHIDLEKNNLLQVEISQNNPFHAVISSMNALMSRIYQNVDELRRTNIKMIEKNDQLTASEEELVAQLEEIESQKDYINYLAYHDALTGLPNRRSFIEHMKDRIHSGQRGAVVLIDIDDFKGINDTHGHVFGDRVLERIAKKLLGLEQKRSYVSRFGGDEFLILIEYDEKAEDVERCLEEIYRVFNEKLRIDDIDIELHFSMGISLFPEDSMDVIQLIRNADLAMYSVKNSGKNGYRLFNASMLEGQIIKSQIETYLREAIENDGFKLLYQPQVDLRTGEIHAFEALLRLKEHSISPAVFIDIAEKNGSIIKIGRIVVKKVIEQIAHWKASGVEIRRVSLNFSVNQLQDTDFITYLQQLLKDYQVDATSLEVEITENIFMEDRMKTKAFLGQLKELGLRISIDDFGAGYSSLNYLTFLPIDAVKLDRSLILQFLGFENFKVMDSLISLIHGIGLEVVAEGIEIAEHVTRLRKVDCDYIQGYYFSRPLEAAVIPQSHLTIYHIDDH
jgi:diguanylate cyclase (GGDEF)-like protein